MTTTALDRLQIQVRDLPHNDLARVVSDGNSNMLLVDINAAGQGWFVDPTPAQHEEYSHRAVDDLWTALENGPAAERVDLLSVLAHELGHLLGHGHQHADPHDVMSDRSKPAYVDCRSQAMPNVIIKLLWIKLWSTTRPLLWTTRTASI